MNVIETESCQVIIAAAAGGRIGQIRYRESSVLVDQHGTDDQLFGWGSYPMVPFAGRIRRGAFAFDGVDYRLPINFETHAIHGAAYDIAWTIDAHETDSLAMSVVFDDPVRWPFGGGASQQISVTEHGEVVEIEMTLAVTAADAPMPASLGWHPWFLKPERLDFSPTEQFVRDDEWITVAERTPPRPSPWDDTFINTEPVTLVYPGRRVTVTSGLTTWVVFDMPEHATCVEPQTAPPDAFNIAPHRLDPGETLKASMTISIGPGD